MSTRIDKDGNRTRPHRCGRNCPKDHEHDNQLLREIFEAEEPNEPGK